MSDEVEAYGARFRLMGPLERLHVDASTALHHGMYVNTAGGDIYVGPYAFFGPDVKLYTGSHDYTKFGFERSHSTYLERNCDIVIGEGVWVAGNATIVGPCTIGEHAVIGASAVVTGNVPPYALMLGNPAVQTKDVRWPDVPMNRPWMPEEWFKQAKYIAEELRYMRKVIRDDWDFCRCFTEPMTGLNSRVHGILDTAVKLLETPPEVPTSRE